jgi:hypothetical protein
MRLQFLYNFCKTLTTFFFYWIFFFFLQVGLTYLRVDFFFFKKIKLLKLYKDYTEVINVSYPVL